MSNQKALEGVINDAIALSHAPILGYKYRGQRKISYLPTVSCREVKANFYGWDIMLDSLESFELYIKVSPLEWGIAAAAHGELDSDPTLYVPGFEVKSAPKELLSHVLIKACYECV